MSDTKHSKGSGLIWLFERLRDRLKKHDAEDAWRAIEPPWKYPSARTRGESVHDETGEWRAIDPPWSYWGG